MPKARDVEREEEKKSGNCPNIRGAKRPDAGTTVLFPVLVFLPFPPFSVHAVRDPTNNVPKEPKGGITQRKDGRTRVRSHLQVFLDIGRKHGVHMSAHRPCPVLGGDTRVCALLGPSKDKRERNGNLGPACARA